jgi:two-component system cell cycle response regulator DivK
LKQKVLCVLENTWALVVEADPHNLIAIGNILSELGVSFKRNTTGKNVASQVRAMQPKPDFILLAMELPEGDALAICREIQADPELAAVPVVAISEESVSGLFQQLKAAGFAGYIRKPLPRRQLGEMLRRMLKGDSGFNLPTTPDQ